MSNKVNSGENNSGNTDDVFLPNNEGAMPLRTMEVSDNREEQKKKVRIFKRNRSFSLIDFGLDGSHQSINDTNLPLEAPVNEYRATQRLMTTATRVMTKASKASLRLRKLNKMLLEAVKYHGVQEIERIIKAGASPNCSCGVENISACHLAAMRSDEALSILIKYGAAKMIPDRIGRTPLHIAAWAGNVKQVAVILGLSEDLQKRVTSDKINLETIEEIKRHRDEVRILVNVRCELPTNMMLLKDNAIDDKCKDYEKNLPMFQVGWTPLHAACVCAQARCVQLLLAAGADPCAHDVIGRTPLDIVGLSCHTNPSSIKPDDFAEVVSTFVELNCYNLTIKNRKTFGSPLHTAVLLESLDGVKVLVEAKMPVNWLDRDGLTPLHLCVKKKLKEHLQILANFGYTDDGKIGNVIDVRDKDCHTVLHKAINDNWLPGVCVALEAGANIIAKDISGETPIHFAAIRGNLEILTEVLKFVQNKCIIDIPNKIKETPLFKAVLHGHAECVKKILEEGASIEVIRSSGVNIFHIAAMAGNVDVLRIVLDHNYTLTRAMINYLSTDGVGYGPIHFAVENNYSGCVKLLLSRNAYAKLKTSQGRFKGSTPMHLAAMNNNVKIAKILFKHERQSVSEPDDVGWTPLHTASYYGSRDMIMFLIEHGADLSASTKSNKSNHNSTVIHFIMNNISKPTEFMENVLDRCISTDNVHYHDKEYKVTVNYNILLPGPEETKHMTVTQALVSTGNRHGQRRLLVHPLLESFLYLKWKTLLPFFYVMLLFHCLFVISLTSYVISVLYYKDKNTAVPSALNTTAWTAILYVSIFLIITQEVLYIKVDRKYFMELETWTKLSSIVIAAILPPLIAIMGEDDMTKIEDDKIKTDNNVQWTRHMASLALLLSWLQMMFLMSRIPNWGYYVLMFGKVSSNVIKILMTFVFLIIGFSLSFMVEFHSKEPFEDPLAAFVKTIVMLTSEFDYNDMVEEKTSSILVARFILVVFVILSAIVLMNLMVGVAVNDLQNLQLLGNITRLAKQVKYLESIENFLYNNRLFDKILPEKVGKLLKFKTISSITLCPGDPSAKCNKVLPKYLREVILEKAHDKSKRIEEEKGSQSFRKKLEEIHEVTVNKTQQNKTDNDNEIREQLEEMAKRIGELNDTVEHERSQTKSSIKEIQYCIQELHSKIDSIVYKLENISTKL